MAETPTTHIRLTRATLNRLRAYRASQLAIEDTGKDVLRPSACPRGGLPPWDAVIERLLDQVEAHRDRARRQTERRRKRKAPTAGAETTPSAQAGDDQAGGDQAGGGE